MNEDQIREYILKYKDSHSKESIKKVLLNAGAKYDTINKIYARVDKRYQKPSEQEPRSTGLILILVLLMILVIGGAISIFVAVYFVNFDALLPNKTDFNYNIRASPTESFAKNDELNIVFRYNGAKKVSINSSQIEIDLMEGECETVSLTNIDLDNSQKESVFFFHGQTGILKFKCSGLEEYVEGTVMIPVMNSRTDIAAPSTGVIRLAVRE